MKTQSFKFAILTFLIFSACSSDPSKEDPLKNTKDLAKKGHIDLYENGAFQVPATHLYLVPPGPGVGEVVADAMGIGAKASLTKALDAASDTYSIMSKGTQATFEVAGDLSAGGRSGREAIMNNLQPGIMILMKKSNDLSKELVGQSWNYGKQAGAATLQTAQEMHAGHDRIEAHRGESRDAVSASAQSLSDSGSAASADASQNFERESKARSEDFILGRAMVDQKILLREKEYRQAQQESLQDFEKSLKSMKDLQESSSKKTEILMLHSYSDGFSKAGDTWSEGVKAMGDASEKYGPSFSMFRAIGYYFKAVVWDFTIESTGKTIAGGLGYGLVNTLPYPVIWSYQLSDQVEIAVKYSALKTGNLVEYVAPDLSSGMGAIIASAKWVGKKTDAGVKKTSSVVVATVGSAGVELTAAAANGGVYLAEGVTYVGVPVAFVGTTAASAISGVVVEAGTVVGGAAASVATAGAAYGTDATLKVAAAGTAVVGTTASTITGASVGLVEVAQGVVVTPALTLGSGVVITYGALTQLSAQTILAASDCAYLVISMEGPRAVVYGVKGLVSTKQDLPPGTVVDLEKLRAQGEVIEKIPLSEEEINRLMRKTSETLPTR